MKFPILLNSMRTNLLGFNPGKPVLFTSIYSLVIFDVLMTFTCWVNIWLINFLIVSTSVISIRYRLFQWTREMHLSINYSDNGYLLHLSWSRQKIISDVLRRVRPLTVDVMSLGLRPRVIESPPNPTPNVACDKVYTLIIISTRWPYGVLLDSAMIRAWVTSNKQVHEINIRKKAIQNAGRWLFEII